MNGSKLEQPELVKAEIQGPLHLGDQVAAETRTGAMTQPTATSEGVKPTDALT
ncbi:hypothetical protein NXS98_16160 [Fontisphaera persica]|uniref:hypothetical protein n=1 Tax=Fontisphaera persica TaxID=2974023 RepID=UPI0024C0B761|nr:hypothetical protein [Fontisphaera persica]WCJ59232.1 hypothetical protein NXS98_16160 [Fontisphaera persica]